MLKMDREKGKHLEEGWRCTTREQSLGRITEMGWFRAEEGDKRLSSLLR